ncbi:heterokaryon incompatibility protein-domain-containing protein [Xylogone sp. PMI_703]|nr:heterokaryon incompatibility protein-domain-containing protein [Xylogone sp. PMI_703]
MLSLLETYISQALEQEPPDVSSLSLAYSRPYKYTAFSDQYSLRLLEIIPSDGSEIQCRLETFNLYSAPPYDALSYTWGDPRPPLLQSIASSYFHKPHFIQCDNHTIHVTTNLYHALQRLRHVYRASPPTLQKYIWIDAVCINQQDLSERSAQVALMEEIYKGAQMVVAWLGKSDRHTKPALRLIKRFADNPPRQIKQYGPLYEKFPGISHKDWEALVAFFQRAYFRRAWIVQEVVLAKKAVAFIGGEKISWESLVKASQFIALMGIWKQLDIITSYFASLSDRMEEQTVASTGATLAGLSQLQIKPSFYYGSGGEVPWYTLTMPINVGRGYLATNKRDHFYSILGVIKDIITSAPSLNERALLSLTQLPVPDYTKSISMVFTEFAKWQLEVSQNLSLLFMVEDQSLRSSDLRDCPSWVPDQSVRLGPVPLHVTANNPRWDPSLSDYGIGLPIDSPGGSIILVRGGIFDTITAVAEPFKKMRDAAKGWIGVMDLVKPLLGNKYPGSGVSYTDVLWRTLIADSHQPLGNANAPRQSPADNRLARAFNEWLITRSERERTIYWNKKNSKKTFEQELDKYVTVLMEMGRLDRSGILFPPAKIKTALTVLGFPPTNKLKIELFERKDTYQAAANDIIRDRRLVLTSRGYLGLVAQSVGVGDQVWILSGPSTPFILRPLSTGRYRLMGEAYIRGIMYGEAVKAGCVQFGDIEIE